MKLLLIDDNPLLLESLADFLGGTISVTSNRRGGTAFVVVLPLSRPERSESGQVSDTMNEDE